LKIPKGLSEAVFEGQTTQWPNGKRKNKDLQNISQKTKDRATRTPLKTWSERRCSRKGKQFLLQYAGFHYF